MDIQLLIVLAALALAVFFIGRRLYRQIAHKESAGCADCSVHNDVVK